MTNEAQAVSLTAVELEALEDEFYALDYKADPWTQADLDRRAFLARILADHNIPVL